MRILSIGWPIWKKGIDSKIADRARGFLANETNSDPAEAIAGHVEGVLRPTQTRRILEQVWCELEDEIEEASERGRTAGDR
jgi:hypothetical protein